jgi:hypothetical protein
MNLGKDEVGLAMLYGLMLGYLICAVALAAVILITL